MKFQEWVAQSVDKPKQLFRNALLIMTVCFFETYYLLTNESFKIVEDSDTSRIEFFVGFSSFKKWK